MKTPLFSSCIGTTHLTAGVWSPTRPGVLFIGKKDGHMDVWDLTDQSHKVRFNQDVLVHTTPSLIPITYATLYTTSSLTSLQYTAPSLTVYTMKQLVSRLVRTQQCNQVEVFQTLQWIITVSRCSVSCCSVIHCRVIHFIVSHCIVSYYTTPSIT